ncbi:MAG: molybdenum cofactor guanylyltransferase [Syntrophaceae bacterium]|nr:molybdenum cofactor guanylyltransferase [Syntrophaceae bacterium]
MTRNITGIILSGGKNTRMGQNKALIPIDGVPIIQRIHALFERLFREVIIVADEGEPYSNLNAKVYADLIPNRGALAGLYTGLFFSSFFFSFCVACDMPFLKESVITYLIDNIDGHDVVVPRTSDGLEPLHAIYSKNCLEPMKKIIEQGRSKIIDLYPMVKVRVIEEQQFLSLDPRKESFINVNTPEELDRLKKRTEPH